MTTFILAAKRRALHHKSPRAVASGILVALVKSGVGVCFLPAPLCQRIPGDGVLIYPIAPAIDWRLGVVWHRERYVSKPPKLGLRCADAKTDKGYSIHSLTLSRYCGFTHVKLLLHLRNHFATSVLTCTINSGKHLSPSAVDAKIQSNISWVIRNSAKRSVSPSLMKLMHASLSHT